MVHLRGWLPGWSADCSDFQDILLDIVEENFELQQYKAKGLITDSFPVHTGKTKLLIRRWASGWTMQPFARWQHGVADFYRSSDRNTFPDVTLLARYFGEKVALFFAFKSFFLALLLLAAIGMPVV